MTPEEPCQNQDLLPMSNSLWAPRAIGSRLIWHLRYQGIVKTLRKIMVRLLSRFHLEARNNDRPMQVPRAAELHATLPAPLHLQPGDWVEVRPYEEIVQTLDQSGRCQGLLFMPGMRLYCGQRLRVFKRLERMILETTGELRQVKHTVLLENAMCSGVSAACDRSCFFFWREAWLKRVHGETHEA
ncbi:MAG: hypothetical protein ACE14L_02210 [Terriglobales bacterium]